MRHAAQVARALAGGTLVVLLLSNVAAGPAPAATVTGAVRVSATIDEAPVGRSTESRPIRLSPRRQATLAVEVTNEGSEPVDIRIVRLEGKVVGLTFFAYDTAVGLRVGPGQTGSRRFLLDLGGLDGQATGLIPGAVKLLDPDRDVVAQQGGVLDVRGSLRSVYGVFGICIAFLTVLSLAGALVGLARHRLPPNRWRRALRFLTPGLGLGLLLNFTLSATRVFVPTPGRWLTIVVVSAAVLFGLGYLTPTPDTGEDDDEDEDELIALRPAPARPELPGAPMWPELATPEGMTALPPEPVAELPDPVAGALPAVAEAPVVLPVRSELATPDGPGAPPAAADAPPPDPDPVAPSTVIELGPPTDPEQGGEPGPEDPVHRPAPPTVAVPTAGPVEP